MSINRPKKSPLLNIVASAMLAVAAAASAGAELLIVEAGEPQTTIVMGSHASTNERIAAEELQLYLRKISGAMVPIVTDAKLDSGAGDGVKQSGLSTTSTRILVGRTLFTDRINLQTADLGLDGYLIETHGSDLVLLGNSEKGSLNAVYGFLEDYLHVRWFMPGEIGEDILPQKTIRVPDLRERHTPDFFAVHGLIWSGHTRGAPDWQRRNRASIGPPDYFFGHSFHHILVETPELRAKHPDWFARDAKGNSKKSGQLCTSHPEVVAIAIRKAALFFDRKPEAATFGVSPEDGGGFCQDWRCKALDEEIGVNNGFITDRFMYFANQIARGLRELDPVKYADKRIGFLAYHNYINPPEKIVPDPMVTVIMTHMHWSYCDVHAMDDRKCSTNRGFARRLQRWQAVSDHVGIYDYFGHNEFYVPWPLWNTTIPQHLAYFKEQGIESFVAESQQNWANQGMNFYAAAKLAWNTNRDMDALWDDFYTRFYGPAAESMRQYWQGWEADMGNWSDHGWDWILNANKVPLIEASRHHLDAAWEAVEAAESNGNNLEKVRGRLQLAEEGFKHTDMWYEMRRKWSANKIGEGITLARQMIDHIKSTKGSEPQVFIEWLALRHIEEQLRAMGGKPRQRAEGPTFPPTPVWDGRYTVPESAGTFRPLRLRTSSVNWGGGAVEIPFVLNQRARVWLAVYEKGSIETGERGLRGAWLRLEPQDKFVYASSGQIFGTGVHVLTWDGTDWEGKTVIPGEYAFDVIAVNNLDRPVLAGPSARTGWSSNLIDTRFDPPEIWVQEYEREYPANQHRAGDVIRGLLGVDYLTDSSAWERRSYNGVLDFDGARTLSGLRVDDIDPNIFWTTHYKGEQGGLYKMLIDRSARGWHRDPSFGVNGFAANFEDRLMAVEPWGPIVYGSHWSQGYPPLSTIESWDKETGEVVREFDVNDVYGNRGPGQIGVNRQGIWMASHSSPKVAFVAHDGRLIWVNRNGDEIGDHVSNEDAKLGLRALHIAPAKGNNIKIQPEVSGHAAFLTTSGNNRGAHFSVLGRDGAGLFEVILPSRLGPFRPDVTWHLRVVDEGGGRYDGIYYGTRFGLHSRSWDYPEDQKFGPGMLMYIPFDLASGELGPHITVVEEDQEKPGRFALQPAYPNPFNSQTVVRFQVPAKIAVNISIYNPAGQRVRTLIGAEFKSGAYRVTWDGRDRSGGELASGVYFLRMKAGDFLAVRAVTLLK